VFLDHLLRHEPRSKFFEHKRSYFFENIHSLGPEFAKMAHNFHFQLPQAATVYRGAFQTIRACPVSALQAQFSLVNWTNQETNSVV
jgi:hypothetical protein